MGPATDVPSESTMSWTATSPSPVSAPMRVVVPPVIVGDRICRIVSPLTSLLEVEEWAGDWWEPSSIPLTTASLSPTADEAVLRARGVPIEDCASSEPRIAQLDIETLMMTRDPERAEQVVFDEDVSRSTGPRRRKYPGNSRFRRGLSARADGATDTDRRGNVAPEWTGPRRRATDLPPDVTSA